MTELGCYRDKYIGAELPVAKEAGQKILCLPLYNGLMSKTVIDICNLIKEFRK